MTQAAIGAHFDQALDIHRGLFAQVAFDRTFFLEDDTNLVHFVFGQVNTQGPFAVIATVCSKCAEYFPSSVTAVQRSAFTRLPAFPAFTIGSIASTIPSFNRGFSLRRST